MHTSLSMNPDLALPNTKNKRQILQWSHFDLWDGICFKHQVSNSEKTGQLKLKISFLTLQISTLKWISKYDNSVILFKYQFFNTNICLVQHTMWSCWSERKRWTFFFQSLYRWTMLSTFEKADIAFTRPWSFSENCKQQKQRAVELNWQVWYSYAPIIFISAKC